MSKLDHTVQCKNWPDMRTVPIRSQQPITDAIEGMTYSLNDHVMTETLNSRNTMVVHKFARANGSTFYNLLSEYPLTLGTESIPGVDVSRPYVRVAKLANKPANK